MRRTKPCAKCGLPVFAGTACGTCNNRKKTVAQLSEEKRAAVREFHEKRKRAK